MPAARGEATVESKKGRIEIDSKFTHLERPERFGNEYLTYVLWAITPQGRAVNLGEVTRDSSDHADLHVTTDLQIFGLIVTAEPYFAVSQPSDVVLLENIVRPDTIGRVEQVQAKYELMKRGQYVYVKPSDTILVGTNAPKVSSDEYEALVQLYQAQNAIQIANSLGADRYAPETFQKAVLLLEQARNRHEQKLGMKAVVTVAREAAQTAEDARAITVRRLDEERLAAEQRTVAQADARAQQAERRAEIERAQAESERAAREQAEDDAKRANALARQEAANAEAARDAAAQIAVSDRRQRTMQSDQQALRMDLLRQLSPILETRDSPRGLLVIVPDSMFQTSSMLGLAASDRLARIAVILNSHPGLRLEVDGHADNQSGDGQLLSEVRASAVRDVLSRDGIPSQAISVLGFGQMRPAVANSTAAGRAQNRRVEIVVSGDPIGGRASWDQTYTLTPRR